ncbi:helix-turn-helix domain-containing protein [Nocardia brasiliensis]|uniref:helix-turn-helix domain-containing protein n=1 Tax=Nocardia brasiliensis TaxID=37326 RepID=UPI003D9228AB
MELQPASDAPGFAARLNDLFATMRRPDGKPYSNAEVSMAMIAAGHRASRPYLSMLRSGKRCNPSPNTVDGLARFFGVPAAYFSDPSIAPPPVDDVEVLARLHNSGLRRLVFEACDLSDGALVLLGELARQLRDREALPCTATCGGSADVNQ